MGEDIPTTNAVAGASTNAASCMTAAGTSRNSDSSTLMVTPAAGAYAPAGPSTAAASTNAAGASIMKTSLLAPAASSNADSLSAPSTSRNIYINENGAGSPNSQSSFTFVESNKGGRILLRAGHRYRVNRNNKNGTSIWMCTSLRCNASLTLDITLNNILREKPHSCIPDFKSETVSIALEKCRKRARTDSDPIPSIYQTEFEKLKTDEFVDELPSFDIIKSQLYRCRNKHHKVKNASMFGKMQDIELVESVRNEFLLIDDGEEERILCFVSRKGRDTLRWVKYYLADGTFNSAPEPCKQIYTLHGDLSNGTETNVVVPLVFALLPNKTQNTYERLFMLLKNAVPGFQPTNFKIDFESAVVNALQVVFPDVHISGCFFHYSQALWRKASNLGLTEVDGGKKYVRLCTAMALLPPSAIPEAWLHLMDNCPQGDSVAAFHAYVSRQWMGQNTSLISCYAQKNRTTNAVEGWHGSLNRRVGMCPTMFRTIDILKSLSVSADFKISQTEAHVEWQKKRKSSARTDRSINLIVDDFLLAKIDIEMCLQRLSNIKFDVEWKK